MSPGQKRVGSPVNRGICRTSVFNVKEEKAGVQLVSFYILFLQLAHEIQSKERFQTVEEEHPEGPTGVRPAPDGSEGSRDIKGNMKGRKEEGNFNG